MKTSIPSDVWEKKKALIARLYKDEEWPLKQVIKQIRTEDFNPSETQLRSRLKKWRVTKPSRQTRKKPQDSQPEKGEDGDDAPEDTSPVESKNASLPTPQPQSAQRQQQQQQQQQQKDIPANPEWYATNGWFPQQQRPQQDVMQPPVMAPSLSVDGRDTAVGPNWAPPAPAPSSESQSQQPLNPRDNSSHISNSTPMMQQFPMVAPTPIGYELHQPAPSSSNVPMSTTPMVAPSYTNSGYPVSTEVCLPPSAPPVGAQWPTGADHIEPDMTNSGLPMSATWFSAPYGAANPPSAAYYQHKSVNPSMAGYGQMMQPMPAQDINQAFSQSPSVTSAFQSSPFDDFGMLKPWRRAIASHYGPEAGGHARVDRQGRQRKPIADRKRKDAPPPNGVEMTGHQPQMQQMQPMQTPMQPQFQHPMMHQEMFAYAGHEQLVQRPPGH
ncbi:hypothetical protein VTN77DRAFT_8566 [Rasamsonia byssochlamydoides]|uniref:uncharacterized protein n=1 Tax=Rasamsonia byssochlamydoides TaxID=89139 RepID=UPI003742826C